jgi:MYXO-CTERM domain-containing protein
VVSVDHAEAGEHEGSILITARPAGDGAGGLGLGAGVRVPVSFVVEDSSLWKVVVVAGLLLLLVAAAAVIRRRRTKV